MKKIFFIAVITLAYMGTSYAQESELVFITEDVVVDSLGTPLHLSDSVMPHVVVNSKYDNTYVYCELFLTKKPGRGVNKLGKKSWAAEINLGINKHPIYITNVDGSIVGFDNKIGILNYMSADGWELVEIYTMVSGSNGDSRSQSCYMMRKRVGDLSQSELELYDKYVMRP